MENEAIKADHFMVVGDNYWAKNRDLTKAFLEWLSHRKPIGAVTVHVRQVDAGAYVDEMGTLHAKRSVELPDVIVPTTAIKALRAALDEIEDCLEPAEYARDSPAWYGLAPSEVKSL
ncbi:hypothetical protein [Mesorhizobium sp. A623]